MHEKSPSYQIRAEARPEEQPHRLAADTLHSLLLLKKLVHEASIAIEEEKKGQPFNIAFWVFFRRCLRKARDPCEPFWSYTGV
jgi:hypothetical protein